MSVETMCVVQAGQISDAVREMLASRLSQVTQAAFGEDASVNWLEVPKGNGWTAGEASTTSVVSMSVPPMEQGDRTRLLHAICDAWAGETDCHINEIVASAISNA